MVISMKGRDGAYQNFDFYNDLPPFSLSKIAFHLHFDFLFGFVNFVRVSLISRKSFNFDVGYKSVVSGL